MQVSCKPIHIHPEKYNSFKVLPSQSTIALGNQRYRLRLQELPQMLMHNSPHPGAFITQAYLEPNAISGRELAMQLGVAACMLSRVLKESSGISSETALHLSKGLGSYPELADEAGSLRPVASAANAGFEY